MARAVVEQASITAAMHTITLQRELVTCGKSTCKRCPHGPYWYAYWRQGKRLRSAYVGRELDAAKVRALVARHQNEGAP